MNLPFSNLMSMLHNLLVVNLQKDQGMSCEGACACEIHSGKCAGCARVRHFFGCAMCDRAFALFCILFGTKLPENATF